MYKLASLLLLISSSAFAISKHKTEASIGVIGANRLLTVGAIGHISHKRTLWGDISQMEQLKYGYLQSSADFFTNGFATVLEPTVEIYPIPLIGVGGGAQWNYSLLDSTEVSPCGKDLACKGLVQWAYGMLTLQGAYKNFFGRAIFEYGHITHNGRIGTDFFSSSSLVSAPHGGSNMNAWFLTAGRNFNEQWSAGAYASRYLVLLNDSSSQKFLFFGSYKQGLWKTDFGLGYSQATLFKNYSGWNSEYGVLAFFQILRALDI
jgi:hypothetical protein